MCPNVTLLLYPGLGLALQEYTGKDVIEFLV